MATPPLTFKQRIKRWDSGDRTGPWLLLFYFLPFLVFTLATWIWPFLNKLSKEFMLWFLFSWGTSLIAAIIVFRLMWKYLILPEIKSAIQAKKEQTNA